MTQFSRWKTYKVTPGPNTRSKDGITLIDDRQKEILIETTLEKKLPDWGSSCAPRRGHKSALAPVKMFEKRNSA